MTRGRVVRVLAGAYLVGMLAVAANVAAPATCATTDAGRTARAGLVRVQVQEDEPGWDCATMGNRVCGPNLDGMAYVDPNAGDDG